MSGLHYLTTRDDARIAYRLDGDPALPLLVLSNSIGTDLRMWDGQIEALARRFRVLRYDARGHGASSVPPGPYPLARLGEDVIELLDALDAPRAHFLGLSLGGLVGQHPVRLVAGVPQRHEDRRHEGDDHQRHDPLEVHAVADVARPLRHLGGRVQEGIERLVDRIELLQPSPFVEQRLSLVESTAKRIHAGGWSMDEGLWLMAHS